MESGKSFLHRVFSGDSGTIDVVLDQKDEVIRAGDRLHGKVVLSIHKESTGGTVEVELIGRERATKKKGLVDSHKEHEFFSFTLPLRDLTTSPLNPGPLTIPFSIDLPAYLPSSSMYKLGIGDVGFNIEYKLTARMGSANKSITVGVAAAAFECTDAPFTMQPTPQPVFGKKGSILGSVVTAASVQNTSIRKGDALIVSLSCRNDSSVSIQRIEVKVVELLNWGLKEGYSKSKTDKRTLVSTMDIDLPGLQREHDSKTCLVDANYPTMEEQNAKYSTMNNDLLSGDNTFEIDVPFHSRDSYTGGILVDIRHYLKIKFVTNNGNAFAAQPSIKVPLTIGLPEKIPTKANMSPNVEIQETSTDASIPVASAVPVPVQNEYHQIEQKVEPLPSTGKMSFFNGVAEEEKKTQDAETLSNLLPVAPTGKVEEDGQTSLSNLIPICPY